MKQCHQKDLIILKKRNKYYSFSYDQKILELIGFNNNFKIFDQICINYKIIDNLEIIKSKNYSDNNYRKYLYIVKIKQILKKIISEYLE